MGGNLPAATKSAKKGTSLYLGGGAYFWLLTEMGSDAQTKSEGRRGGGVFIGSLYSVESTSPFVSAVLAASPLEDALSPSPRQATIASAMLMRKHRFFRNFAASRFILCSFIAASRMSLASLPAADFALTV